MYFAKVELQLQVNNAVNVQGIPSIPRIIAEIPVPFIDMWLRATEVQSQRF